MPKSRRPPDSTSRLASSLARTRGLRWGRMMMPVPSSRRLVCAARKVSATTGSRMRSRGAIGEGGACVGEHHVLAAPERLEARRLRGPGHAGGGFGVAAGVLSHREESELDRHVLDTTANLRCRAGVPAAPHRFDDALRARASAHLTGFERRAVPPDGLRPAAVAVVLLPDAAGRACFLITRRAAGLRAHARQWALPGGSLDRDETPERAALRELTEEVGLTLAPEA